LRSGRAWIALWALAAASQTDEQRHCQRQIRDAHRHILPEKLPRIVAAKKIKIDNPVQGPA
jgi:hypothetical protein